MAQPPSPASAHQNSVASSDPLSAREVGISFDFAAAVQGSSPAPSLEGRVSAALDPVEQILRKAQPLIIGKIGAFERVLTKILRSQDKWTSQDIEEQIGGVRSVVNFEAVQEEAAGKLRALSEAEFTVVQEFTRTDEGVRRICECFLTSSSEEASSGDGSFAPPPEQYAAIFLKLRCSRIEALVSDLLDCANEN